MLGLKVDKTGFPDLYDIEADPKEQRSLTGTHAWAVRHYMAAIAAYNESLKKYPNQPPIKPAIVEAGDDDDMYLPRHGNKCRGGDPLTVSSTFD